MAAGPAARRKPWFGLVVGLVAAGLCLVGLPFQAAADGSGEVTYAISPSLPVNVQAFLRTETSTGVFNVDYHYGHSDPAPNGAFQRNVHASSSSWWVEDQRYGDVDVVGGVLHDDLKLLDTGLRMFDFAFEREAPNGSFPGSDRNSLFHGTAFFLAAAGPAMLVLKNWTEEPSLPGSLAAHVDWEIGRLKAAAVYLVDKWWSRPGHIDDGGKEERKFEAAVALQSIGVLAGDTWLEQRAAVYAHEAMNMTESDGVWTEHGITRLCCHDSSYQAVGLVYATRYLTLLLPGTSIYQAVYKNVAAGEGWELSRTNKDGTVNRAGDDRTGPTCPEQSTSGGCKDVNYQAIASALMRWSVISDDFSYNRRAYHVWIQDWLRFPGSKLPPAGVTVSPHNTMSVTNIDYHYPFFIGATRFEPVEPVKIYFSHVLVGQTVTDQIGSFGGHSPVGAVKFTPPLSTTPGRYALTVKGAYGITRKTMVTITPGAPLAAFVSPSSHTSRQAGVYHWPFFLGVSGFLPYEQVTVYWGATSVGTKTCDLTGAFGGHSGIGPMDVVSPTAQPGRYVLTAKGADGRVAHTDVTITKG